MRTEPSWQEYFSQLSIEDLEQRILYLLEMDASKLEPLEGAKRAVEAVAIAKELERRGKPLIGTDGNPVKLY